MKEHLGKSYMRTDEAARYLCVSKSLLDKLRVGGDGPPYSKIGRAVLYSRIELDRWLDDRAVISTSENLSIN